MASRCSSSRGLRWSTLLCWTSTFQTTLARTRRLSTWSNWTKNSKKSGEKSLSKRTISTHSSSSSCPSPESRKSWRVMKMCEWFRRRRRSSSHSLVRCSLLSWRIGQPFMRKQRVEKRCRDATFSKWLERLKSLTSWWMWSRWMRTLTRVNFSIISRSCGRTANAWNESTNSKRSKTIKTKWLNNRN